MGIAENMKSAAGALGKSAAAFLRRLGAMATMPLAIAVAVIGQFALAGAVSLVTPKASDFGAVTAGADGAGYLPFLLLVVQGGLLVYAVIRAGLTPARVYLASAALVWAFGSLLLMAVALQCDLYGLCL